jgi:FMN-dependent dehydrogenase
MSSIPRGSCRYLRWQAVKMTRLSCHRFRSNEVRLWLSVIASHLGNLATFNFRFEAIRAVLCGRASAYGLAAAGEAGVARALAILRADVERTLKLLGCPSVAALDRSYVEVAAHWR